MDQRSTHHDSLEQNSLLIDIATRNVICLAAEGSVGEAALVMRERRISSIVMTDHAGHPVGIVTERNILRAMQESCPHEAGLGRIMSSPVVTVPVSTTTFDAYRLCLSQGIRHLVIVDEQGLLAGVASETDFRLHLNLTALAGRRRVASVAKRSAVILPPATSLQQALDLMLAQRKSCVVVVDDNKPVGIVTERDVVRFYSGEGHYADISLGEVMVSPVHTIPYDATTNQAAEEMLALKLRHIVVVNEDGSLAGLVSEHDLTQLMATGLAEERDGLEENFLRTLINTLPDLVWLKDADGVFLACNARFEQLYGASEADITGKTDYDFVDRQTADSFRKYDLRAIEANCSSINEEWLTFAANGYRGLFETVKTPMRDSNGKLLGVLAIARDISRRHETEAALAASEYRYRTLIEHSPFCIHEIDLQGKLQSMNRAGLDMMKLENEQQVYGMPYLDAVSKHDRERIEALMQDAYAGEARHFEFDAASRRTLHFKSCFIPIRDGEGKVIKLMGITEDITELKRAEEDLRITASVFDTTQEAILITDADNRIIDVNPAFVRITGYIREEVIGRNPGLLRSGRQGKSFYQAMWKALHEHGSWRGEIWNRRKNGEIYPEMLSINVIYDSNGNIQRHVGVFSDISHIKQHEAELNRVAHYDALTGIPNRVLLADRMKQAIAQTSREQEMMAVCYLDLDGFKPINDNMGHDAGDQVLVEVARRIAATIRGGDTVARLGGDEFVILLLGLKMAEECVGTLERLLHEIALPIAVESTSITLGASIGVSIYPLDNEEADTLLRHADQAMYLAKQAGKHRFHIYDPSLDQRARDYNDFMKSIRHALELGQFELYYQPKINLKTKQLLGVEALIRWNHPQRGALPPAEFLHALENTEFDVRIGEWVIDTALAQLRQWRNNGLDIEISINISGYHLESPGFVEMLGEKMARYPELPAGKLQIEVLETTALEDVATVGDIIRACHNLGVWFALDDFGTGYSSLSYLSRLPVDVLKIDQSFVRDMLEDRGDMAIVQGIIALAQAFERHIVAEGIETPEHYRTLVELGCEIGQGYGIALPMPAHELEHWHAK